jgi:hypothetical protein
MSANTWQRMLAPVVSVPVRACLHIGGTKRTRGRPEGFPWRITGWSTGGALIALIILHESLPSFNHRQQLLLCSSAIDGSTHIKGPKPSCLGSISHLQYNVSPLLGAWNPLQVWRRRRIRKSVLINFDDSHPHRPSQALGTK